MVRKIYLTVCLSVLITPAIFSTTRADCPALPDISGRNIQSRFAGALNTIQNNPTGFGNAAAASLSDSEGSELDRLYVTNNGTTLYIGITGNTPRHDVVANTVLIFIDTDAGATPSTLATSGFTGPNISQALKNMSGVTLDFDPDYCIAVWNDIGASGGWHGVLHNLHNATDSGVLLTLGTNFFVNDDNLLGVSSTPGDDPLQQQEQAASAVDGFEFAVALSTLGITSSSTIRMQALVANQAGSVSNQSLPPLNPTIGTDGGKVNCLGVQGSPPENIIDFSSANYPADQFVAVTLTPGGVAPVLPLDGTGLTSPATGYPAGSLRSTQNNYTCFGDAAAFSAGVTGGNELDLLYVLNDFAKLYIGLAGNLELTGGFTNAILVFIETSGTAATNTLQTANFPNTIGPGVLQNLDGMILDTGIAPNWVVMIWREGNQIKAIRQNIDNDGAETPLVFTIDANNHKNPGINAIATDFTNIDGVNDVSGDDPINQTAFAKTAKKGAQISLSLGELGIASPIGQSVKIMTMIASKSGDSGQNAFVSNQCLPPLNPTPLSGTPVLSSDTFVVNQPITDNATIFSTQTATNAAALDRVTGCKVTVNITHPNVAQLKIDLRHDDTGRRINLYNGNGTGANMTNTVFVQGGTALSGWTAGGTGNWQPVESLLTMNGVDPNPSTWTLIVQDTVTGQTGTLTNWKLDLQWDKGGGVNCVGEQNTDAMQGTVNIVDLSNNSLYPGNQYITKALVNASGPVPSQFKADDVPGYFGDSTAARPGALAVQNNFTCFGNAIGGSPQSSTGSELDQMFITNLSDRIEVAITGNIEKGSANGVVLLLDTTAGGENLLTGNPTPPTPLGGDAADQVNKPGLNGLTLDSGFNPDYAITGIDVGGRWQVHLTNLTTNTNRFVGLGSYDSGNGFIEAPVTPGSEIDELLVMNDATNLFLGLTGNIEGNNNGYVIFLDTIAGGTNVLSTAGGNGWPGHLTGMNGDTLPTGFGPDYAIVVSRSGAFYNTAKLVNLSSLPTPPTDITFAANFSISPNTFVGNNNNYVGVNELTADDPTQQAINAATATSGVQFAIARSSIGSPANGATIKIFAVLVGSGGYWSNQTMPPLGGGVTNRGDGPVNGSTYSTASYLMNASGTAPTSYNGQNINSGTNMGPGLLATQNNFTQFGNQVLSCVGCGNTNCMQLAIDDTNLGGVTGCGSPCFGGFVTDAGNVNTGFEFDIPLADIGMTGPIGTGNTPTIKVMAVLTGNTGFMSNQFLPGVGGAGAQANLGWPTAAPQNNLANYNGNQYLTYTTVVPCSPIAGDIDGNGIKDFTDVTTLVNVLLGSDTTPCHVQKADVNGDTFRNGRDIQAFVTAFVP